MRIVLLEMAWRPDDQAAAKFRIIDERNTFTAFTVDLTFDTESADETDWLPKARHILHGVLSRAADATAPWGAPSAQGAGATKIEPS